MASVCLFGSVAMESEARQQRVVVLLGSPGSGKGTQAKKLTQLLGIPHISTGDLFRENVGNHTALGKQAKSFMDAGRLVPDEIVLKMLFDRVARQDCLSGYLLDGFPRTISQAEALDGHPVQLSVFNLSVSDDVVMKRLSGRLTCSVCGNMYNRYFSPPAKEGICDQCGGKLIQRPDDRSEVIQERLKVYKKQTEPLIYYYESRGVLTTVDGEQSADAIHQQMAKKTG